MSKSTTTYRVCFPGSGRYETRSRAAITHAALHRPLGKGRYAHHATFHTSKATAIRAAGANGLVSRTYQVWR